MNTVAQPMHQKGAVGTGEQKGVVELDFQPVRAVLAANGSRNLKIGNITDVDAVNTVANVVGGGTVSGIGSLHLELLAVGFGMKLNLGLPMGPHDGIGRPSSGRTFRTMKRGVLKARLGAGNISCRRCRFFL